MDCYKTVRKPPTLLQTVTDLLTAFTDYYKTFSHPLHTTLYSIADISKQINEGQEKWSQGVDLMSITDVNNYIKFKIFEYGYFKLMNDDL